MYEYNICNQANEDIFAKQCLALEKKINNLEKLELLTDVDGSKIQSYRLENKNIKVFNSNDVDAVYIKSEIELTKYFA